MDYLPVFVLFVAAVVIASAILVLSSWLGKGIAHPRKNMPFECGVPSISNTTQRIPVRFYLVAILFLLFDVEVVFFYPWAIVFKEFLAFGSFIFWEMAVFAIILLAGLFYAYQKRVFDWE
jgi:NADH-quinone oxidoreductase subunit A